uniref:Uncharacterized protein n=1 Tax=Glossina palpalis gambiensis TaxID=67801 RepID=A0A1B0B5D3_9MUSC
MESSPSTSIEKQIDNFLEHFKRSASKAIETDWCNLGSSNANTNANPEANNPVTVQANIASPDNGHCSGGHPLLQKQASQLSLMENYQHLLQRTRSRSNGIDITDLTESLY